MKYIVFVAALLVLASAERLHVEYRADAPIGWMAEQPSMLCEKLYMTIAVKQTNTDVLEQALLIISDPASPEYGRWMTSKQVHELVAPLPESVQVVEEWLTEAGVDLNTVERTYNSDLISFETTVEIAERLVGGTYYKWTHVDSGKSLHRLSSNSYSLPAHVVPHVDIVTPTLRFPNIQKQELKVEPEATVTPSFLKNLYGTSSYTSSNSKTQVAVAGLIGQYFEQSDLDLFFQKYDPASSGRKPNVVGYDGPNPGIEANLDIQYVMAMSPNVNATFWSIGAKVSEPFLTLAQQLYAAGNPPAVMSISYGANEDSSQTQYYDRLNTEFKKVGAIGITMLVASGDGGVGGGQPGLCFRHFIPTFPGGSPWLTSVGGTQGTSESGAGLSSGGFSNVFPQPSYQQAAVQHYFSVAQNLPSASKYNKTGNGFPDVAAEAQGFVIVNGGRSQEVAGTSAAAPTFGGVIALVNDVRANAGKSNLGFMQPFIYANPSVFNDVTSGNNPGCFTSGFYASQGWDPVTGMGSPNFKALTAAALALP